MTFDKERAKKNLIEKEKRHRQIDEEMRLQTLSFATKLLKQEFAKQGVEVYLVGSITQPFKFHQNSDVDIVLKKFKGDRFEIWEKLEEKLGWKVEIILYEKSRFPEYIDKDGLKVV